MSKKILYYALLPFLTVLELVAKAMVWVSEHVVIEARPMRKRDWKYLLYRELRRGWTPRP